MNEDKIIGMTLSDVIKNLDDRIENINIRMSILFSMTCFNLGLMIVLFYLRFKS